MLKVFDKGQKSPFSFEQAFSRKERTMYRERSMTTTIIMVVVWMVNIAVSAIAMVLLAALLRGTGATWMPELSFWQAVLIRLIFKSLLWDALKVTPRD